MLNNLQQRARSGDVEARADLQALGFGPKSDSEERKGVPKFGHRPFVQSSDEDHHSQVGNPENAAALQNSEPSEGAVNEMTHSNPAPAHINDENARQNSESREEVVSEPNSLNSENDATAHINDENARQNPESP